MLPSEWCKLPDKGLAVYCTMRLRSLRKHPQRCRWIASDHAHDPRFARVCHPNWRHWAAEVRFPSAGQRQTWTGSFANWYPTGPAHHQSPGLTCREQQTFPHCSLPDGATSSGVPPDCSMPLTANLHCYYFSVYPRVERSPQQAKSSQAKCERCRVHKSSSQV